MKNLLTKIWAKRIFISIIFLFVLGLIPDLANQAFAAAVPAAVPANAAANAQFQSSIQDSIGLISVLTQVLSKILWPLLALIGGLMDNSLLFGNGMEARLREIWIIIRNIVNILFVIGLLVVALYNVLGLGEEGSSLSIKSALPKIIVGIIAINFSFLGIKIFLDGVNIMTSAVFALPQQVGEGTLNIDQGTEKLLCAKIQEIPSTPLNQGNQDALNNQQLEKTYRDIAATLAFKALLVEDKAFLPGDNLAVMKEKVGTLESDQQANFNAQIDNRLKNTLCDNGKFTPIGKQFLSNYNSRNAAFAMALNMGKLALYDVADISTLSQTVSSKGTIDRLAISMVFSLILYIVYASAFVALFIVLIARLVFMWISIAISPVLILLLASPDLKGKLGSIGDLTDKFVKTAIAPIIIGLSMSVGWIMLRALQSVNNTPLAMQDLGVPVSGLNNLQDLTIAITAIAIVWVGVFTAADSTIAQVATNWVRDNVKNAGKWIGTIPLKHAPIFPIKIPNKEGEPENYSFDQIKDTLTRRLSKFDNSSDKLTRDLGYQTLSKVQPREYRSITRGGDLKQTVLQDLATNSGRGLSNDNLKELKENLKSKPRMIDEIKALRGQDNIKLADALTAIKDADSAEALKKAGTELQKVTITQVNDFRREKTKSAKNTTPTTPSDAPENPAPTATPPPITGDSISFVNDASAKTAIADQLQALVTELKGNKDKSNINATLTRLTQIKKSDSTPQPVTYANIAPILEAQGVKDKISEADVKAILEPSNTSAVNINPPSNDQDQDKNQTIPA